MRAFPSVYNRVVLRFFFNSVHNGAQFAIHEVHGIYDLSRKHGWHAFRRGVATNLKRLKVDDDFIQRVLRHGDSNTTRRFYIKELVAGVSLSR